MVTLPYNTELITDIFCDYDDTLAIHDSTNVKIDGDLKDFQEHGFDNDPYYYIFTDVCEPNIPLHDLLREIPARKHVLTWAHNNLLYKARENFLAKYYRDIKFDNIFIVGSRDLKPQFIRDYMNCRGLTKDNVLFVEDNGNTLYSCADTCLTLYVPDLYARYVKQKG